MFAVVSESTISVARISFADIAGSTEDFKWGPVVDNRRQIETFYADGTADPATVQTFDKPGDRLLAPVAVSHDWDSSSRPIARGSAARSRRRASPAPTVAAAPATATAAASYSANGTTGDSRAAATAASTNEVIATTTVTTTYLPNFLWNLKNQRQFTKRIVGKFYE